MPKFTDRFLPPTPQYRRHKPSGQAVVTIHGKDHYLGPFGSKASKVEYDRIIAEWLAAGRRLPSPQFDLSVDEVISAYWKFAKGYFRKRGEPTGELANIRYAMRPLQALYGDTPVTDFGPLALKAVRQDMLKSGLSRNVINSRIRKIKRVFAWAVSEELIPVTIHQALLTVEGLKKDRSPARETRRVRPVSDATVDATLLHMAPVPADMVRLQRLTGMRPGEVRIVRPCDVDRSTDPWVYRPEWHKTEHHDRERMVFLGPRAQSILRPYLLRDPEAYCFVPSESQQRFESTRRANRKTPVQPSQQGQRGRTSPARKYRKFYSSAAYAWAIRRACAAAAGLIRPKRPKDPERIPTYKKELASFNARIKQLAWSPNKLRHTAATELRRRFGVEHAKVVLGNSRVETTQIYAERDLAMAAEIMEQVG